MTANMNFIKDSLQKDGYIVVDQGISSEALKAAQLAYQEISKKAELSEYKYIRVYDDYVGSMNISAIEMCFHPRIIDQRMIQFLNYSNLSKIAIEILGEKIKMSLSRYHMTKNYSHVGNWHRDSPPKSIKSLQMSIFLFDEMGIEFIPRSHIRDYSQIEKRILNKSKFGDLPNSIHVSAKAGSMLIFNPAIIHRGRSVQPRANIHFRFESDHDYLLQKNDDLEGFDKHWKNILNNKNSIIIDDSIIEYDHSKKISDHVRRFFRTFVHYAIFWLPLDSWIYKKTGANPSLKMRILFKLS